MKECSNIGVCHENYKKEQIQKELLSAGKELILKNGHEGVTIRSLEDQNLEQRFQELWHTSFARLIQTQYLEYILYNQSPEFYNELSGFFCKFIL